MSTQRPDPVVARIVKKHYGDHDPEPAYTYPEIRTALNHAADLILVTINQDETNESIRDNDLLNLIVNAAGYLLQHPGASLTDVITACYTDVELDAGDFTDDELGFDSGNEQLTGTCNDFRLPEKGSANWNTALVRQVTGWLA